MIGIFVLLAGLIPTTAHAQIEALTTEDRLGMLYSSQLQFSRQGDPLITVGLVENVDYVEFEPEAEMRVLPLGEGGPEIRLPGGVRYRVSVRDGVSGDYRYWAVVARLLPDERRQLRDLAPLWNERGYESRSFDLGSYFAVRGEPFDNRQIVLAVGGLSDRESALDLAGELEQSYGVQPELHVEMLDFPGGEIVLSSETQQVEISHHDLLWVNADGAAFEIDGQVFPERDGSPGDARRFVGSLIFTVGRSGQLTVIDQIPAERLLEGILPAEIYASAPLDALRAQAVAARSDIIANIGVRYLADPYLTCATVMCQVYSGIDAEHPQTSQAIAETRGQVLLYDDHVAHTVYSASCGGSLGDYHTTWGTEPVPYLRHHIDTLHPEPELSEAIAAGDVEGFLETNPDTYGNIENFGGPRSFRWQVELNQQELTDAVNGRYDVGQVVALEILARDASGRVVRLRIVGLTDTVVVERELPIRRALGGLRSALFVMQPSEQNGVMSGVVIDGGGFGHGVGLCQTGAIGAAQRGLDYVDILSHYYPGTDARRLWE